MKPLLLECEEDTLYTRGMEKAKNGGSKTFQQTIETLTDVKKTQEIIAGRRLDSSTPWENRALCKVAANPDIFISDKETDIERAKMYCAACDVGKLCLEAAMREEVNQPLTRYTVRGGLSGDERVALARRTRNMHRRTNIGNASSQ